MFITRKEFERQIKKAKKQGVREAYEKCSMQNSIDSVSRNMYDNVDRVHMELDKILIRLDKLENKRSNEKKEVK